ncbi:MAG: ComF family protein, partial [Dehalococcoidia bacterium]|nr:ComF family protein [Dehalococcoidia bacterium]
MLESIKTAILDTLFPPSCIGCGKSGALICPKCEGSLPRHLQPFCSLCTKPLPRIHTVSGQPRLCARCVRSPLAIDGIRSAFIYDGAIRAGILSLKYKGVRSLAEPLGKQLGSYLTNNSLPADVIVPVPLHPRRMRERGYNQSALLARRVSEMSGLTILDKALARIKDTPAQVRSASAEERRQNVQGAFQALAEAVKGARILVVDDVCTTGSTLEACSLALRAAGAKSVWGLTLAREGDGEGPRGKEGKRGDERKFPI